MRRYIINPGSVGQPRYGSPEASYVLLDDQALTVEFRFVDYDVRTAQDKSTSHVASPTGRTPGVWP